MSQGLSSSDRGPRRCLRACARCRDMKVRCSGTQPCTRCLRKREACVFRPEDVRVTISQRHISPAVHLRSNANSASSYLESLENRVPAEYRSHQRQSPAQVHSTAAQTFALSPPPSTFRSEAARSLQNSPLDSPLTARDTDTDARITQFRDQENSRRTLEPTPTEFSRNPLVDTGETFAPDPTGKYWYMGPTSSWAFCRRVLAIIGSRMPKAEPLGDPWDLEALNITLNPIGVHDQPEIDNLPSHDYAVFLVSTVKYHLGSLCEMLYHDSFYEQMERFYRSPSTEANRARYWYCQFLFILAFGEALTIPGSPKSVPGISYASRALSLIPSIIPLDKDSLAAVEALSIAALYLQAVDLRLMAFQLIGQALRICVMEGWHRHMPPEDVGLQHSQRCNSVFWTAYVMDREFGTLVGAPSSIRDADITTKLPCDVGKSLRSDALTLQIRLARLTATILTGVYGADRNSTGTLLKDTQSVLHSIAAISRDLSAFLDNHLQGTDIRTSKIATRLILSYHHCVVLTTRPLVMCILQRRLATHSDDNSIPDGPICSLLQSCTYSALNILKTLKALGDGNLLDSFLPFQLEAAFSSAFLVYVIDAVAPGFLADRSWLVMAHGIFDTMIARGSPAARLRKREFQRLEQAMVSYLQERSKQTGTAAQRQDGPGNTQDVNAARDNDMNYRNDPDQLESYAWGLLEANGGFAMSPTEILTLADELQVDDFLVDDPDL